MLQNYPKWSILEHNFRGKVIKWWDLTLSGVCRIIREPRAQPLEVCPCMATHPRSAGERQPLEEPMALPQQRGLGRQRSELNCLEQAFVNRVSKLQVISACEFLTARGNLFASFPMKLEKKKLYLFCKSCRFISFCIEGEPSHKRVQYNYSWK